MKSKQDAPDRGCPICRFPATNATIFSGGAMTVPEMHQEVRSPIASCIKPTEPRLPIHLVPPANGASITPEWSASLAWSRGVRPVSSFELASAPAAMNSLMTFT